MKLAKPLSVVLLTMSLFLLAALGFSVDMSNLWFNRQWAQSAADASCTAAAMDMLYAASGVGSSGGFTAGTPFSRSGSPSAAPCVYATKNMGAAPSTLTPGTQGYDVNFTFPTTLAGLRNPYRTPPPACDMLRTRCARERLRPGQRA